MSASRENIALVLGSTGSSGGPAASSLRRISEDPMLRPFLSSLFDAQNYVKNIIRDGKSEDCLQTINDCMDNINDEIQRYIGQHKDVLMSGMQDVASLANRYHTLSEHSRVLQSTVTRLKKDMSESYNVVKSRTYELERIHETSSLITQLKQFVKARAQLDVYLKNPDDKDARSLAGVAKTLSELEKLIQNSKLLEVKLVQDYAPSVKSISGNIRALAQEKLLEAIHEKNQAAIGNYLQVFYNLDCLADIVLLVVDHMVKTATDASRAVLNFDALYQLYATVYGGSTAGTVSGKKTGPGAAGGVAGAGSGAQTGKDSSALHGMHTTQLRIAMKETCHAWSSQVYDHVSQMGIVQRVLLKKEDAVTHESFRDKLKQVALAANNAQEVAQNKERIFLAQAQLVSLFYHRFSQSLQEVMHEKIRSFPQIAGRIYPMLRKAAIEVMDNIHQWHLEDQKSALGSSALFFKALQQQDGGWMDGLDVVGGVGRGRGTQEAAEEDISGVFGSLMWTSQDMFDMSLSFNNPASGTGGRALTSTGSRNAHHSGTNSGSAAAGSGSVEAEHDLVLGLKPCRDRFLVSLLDRMHMPILQMFPEVEGYTAAIPSKRDLQTFIKTIVSELVNFVIESDYYNTASNSTAVARDVMLFLSQIEREVHKVVHLLLSKIECMAVTGTADSRKVAFLPASANPSTQSSAITGVQRSNSQEHNIQLYVLLVHLMDSLDKIPSMVMKGLEEHYQHSTSGSATAANAVINAAQMNTLLVSLQDCVGESVRAVEEVGVRYVLQPFVAMIADYATAYLHTHLHREATSSSVNSGGAECSHTVQHLLALLTHLVQSFLLIHPTLSGGNSPATLQQALYEVYIRVLQAYISCSVFVRPVSESSRLRAMKDLAMIETVLGPLCVVSSRVSSDHCAVMLEYKAYCRYLFEESKGGIQFSAVSGAKKTTSNPPSKLALFQLPYVRHMRPSTVLGFLVAAAPVQCPLPSNSLLASGTSQAAGGESLSLYLETLLDIASASNQSTAMNSATSLYLPLNIAKWKAISAEKQAWEKLQICLDTFFQRIAVAEGGEKERQAMRQWYEAIMDIGAQFF